MFLKPAILAYMIIADNRELCSCPSCGMGATQKIGKKKSFLQTMTTKTQSSCKTLLKLQTDWITVTIISTILSHMA